MPSFGGFAINTGGLVNGLINNAVGGVANSLFGSALQGFTGGAGQSLIGQLASAQNADNRVVSLRPRDKAVSTVLGNQSGLMAPLYSTNKGMIWPYTPVINYNHNVVYESVNTVHANQDFHIYTRTPAVELTVDGSFTVQTQQEGAYAMACMHFLRSVAKMNFGETDPNAGTPPPILLFNAYGPFVFKDLPVIVKSFTINFPEDVDYVSVMVGSSDSSIPALTPNSPGQTLDRRVFGQQLPPLAGANVSPDYNEAFIITGANKNIMGVGGVVPPVIGNVETIAQGTQGTVSQTNANKTFTVWLPSLFKISAILVAQHTPATLRKRFNLPAYRNGASNQQDFI
jgi:hypothetical protein